MATFKLKFPVICNDEIIETLTFPERLQVKHLRAMDEASGEVGKIVALIASITTLPKAAVDQIDAEDFTELSREIADFLPVAQPTGPN